MPHTNADWYQEFAVSHADGTPIDLSGAGLKLQLRTEAGAPTVALELSLGTGLSLIGAAEDGKFALRVPAAQMATVQPGRYVFDVVRSLGAERTRLFGGAVDVLPGVTQ